MSYRVAAAAARHEAAGTRLPVDGHVDRVSLVPPLAFLALVLAALLLGNAVLAWWTGVYWPVMVAGAGVLLFAAAITKRQKVWIKTERD
jgi:hypothetical protein